MARRWHKVCRSKRDLALPFALEGEKLFVKACYSAFRGTVCGRWLKRRKVRDLVVCGVKTNLCVESTVRDAFDLGFSVFVPMDACGASKRSLHLGSLRNMAVGFAQIVKSGVLLGRFYPSSQALKTSRWTGYTPNTGDSYEPAATRENPQ